MNKKERETIHKMMKRFGWEDPQFVIECIIDFYRMMMYGDWDIFAVPR
jgi:hypothetical protein